jgi:hypothetical protein
MFGNGLDMRGHVDSTFKSKIKGGIWLIRMEGDYSGPGGVWVESEIERRELDRVNVQPARWRVMSADNRPWRSFCRAVVEMVREPGK